MTPVIIGDAALYLGDCIEVMRGMADNSVDAIVTDPPYHLTNNGGGPARGSDNPYSRSKAGAATSGFMGQAWDGGDIAFRVELWTEAMRVLKPGGHMLAFSGSRTYHRMAVAIEDAGFEIRDQIMWVYGSGFPKSRNIAEQDMESEDAEKWEGWGTALKPAHEPICVARKPLIGTVAANVLAHGTGAINIDGCRIGTETRTNASKPRADRNGFVTGFVTGTESAQHDHGRWPANLIHDGSDEVVALFPREAGASAPVRGTEPSSMTKSVFGQINRQASNAFHGDSGSAARFFYCAKASRKDRNEGLSGSDVPVVAKDATMRHCETADWSTRNGNHHPTVKPTDLMAYLVRLVTPPGGLVMDMFMGSGSTGKAAMREGFRFVGIDMTPEYVEIARARIEHELACIEEASAPAPQMDMFEVPA